MQQRDVGDMGERDHREEGKMVKRGARRAQGRGDLEASSQLIRLQRIYNFLFFSCYYIIILYALYAILYHF